MRGHSDHGVFSRGLQVDRRGARAAVVLPCSRGIRRWLLSGQDRHVGVEPILDVIGIADVVEATVTLTGEPLARLALRKR